MAKNLTIFLKLVFSVAICLIIGFFGSGVTTPSINNWYRSLNKSPLNPPNWIFAPVWTLLFLLMGVSLFLVLNKKTKIKKQKHVAVFWFVCQLLLNFLWSFQFFGLHLPFLALIDITFLWITILICIKKFYPISKIASHLLYPYFFWVTFAAFLNFSIIILN